MNQIIKEQNKLNSRNRIEFSDPKEETEEHDPYRPLKPVCLNPPPCVETTIKKGFHEHTAWGRTQFGNQARKISSPRTHKHKLKTENRYYKLVTPTLYDNELVLNKLSQIETAEERNMRTLHNGIMIK